ncbi:hypothetical protein Leryth_022668 [Lithospermum erythrorhizon]|nr:hypothetical protein Leryth_022668 [Lithospermum erythrorhizon]
MACSTRIISRISSRLHNFSIKLNKKSPSFSPETPFLKSTSPSSHPRLSRLPVELSSMVTMLPLHSAIASARLTSSLSIDSQSWGLVPQGISMPL